MIEKISKAGERNKIVPGWLRAVFVLPFVIGGIILMVSLGNIYDELAIIQASWFDGKYYILINMLMTILVYLLILVISLLPGLILTFIARRVYEKRRGDQ